MVLAVIGIAVPSFVIAPLLIKYVAVKWGLLPVASWGTWKHVVLPAFALSVGPIATIARLTRANLIEVLTQDYMETARSKGLSPARMIVKHALRNAVLPVVTLLGALLANVLTGSFVIEKIFAIPGMGKYFLACCGLFLIVLLALLAVFGPLLTDQSYSGQNLLSANQPPSGAHWFGTDDLGRDVFARILYGSRISLTVGLAAALIDFFIGIIYGGIAGYFGGRVDNAMMRFVDMLYGIPYLLVVILLMVVMGPGLLTIILALTATGWIGMARIVRGQVLQLKSSEYVLAARTLGAGSWYIIRRHMLPNAVGVIIVQVTFSVPSAIFAEAFLSFLGLGIQPPLASWGTMANDALPTILSGNWWRLFFPAFFISMNNDALLEVDDLHVSFSTYGGEVKAVRGVSLRLHRGETLAIVGESGCGKSVTARSIMRLLPKNNSKITEGSIRFNGRELTRLSEKQMRDVRGSDIAIIFQDAMTALNPTMTIGEQLMEGVIRHQRLSRTEARKRAVEMLQFVGIRDPELRLKQHLHQFSGGMRQRIMIAMAAICSPA
ncbi:hypothetical protein BGX30_007140, partial [Mortierella sp. GBA39]